MPLVAWLLVVHGVVQIVTLSNLFAPVRAAAPWEWLRTLLSCPMCAGYWFGVILSATLGAGPVRFYLAWPIVLAALGDGAAASAVAWAAHVLLGALRDPELSVERIR